MKTFKKLKKGFTLVELVVVIAVIAILAAVSVGAYFGVTESANNSKLEQEAKQVYTAIQTVALAPNDHSSLSKDGLVITDADSFEDKLFETLGKEVSLKENGFKDEEKPTIFFTQKDVSPLGGADIIYSSFEYHVPGINGKAASADLVTGDVNIITSNVISGEDVVLEGDYREFVFNKYTPGVEKTAYELSLSDEVTLSYEAEAGWLHSDGTLRIYKGKSVTFTILENITITGFELTGKANDSGENYKLNINETIAYFSGTKSSQSVYVEDTNVFTLTAVDKQIRLDSIKIYGTGFEEIVPCEHNYVNGTCSNCGETDPDFDPSTIVVTTIADALTAPEGATAQLTGTVIEFYQPWSEEYENVSFYIEDDIGDRILIFRTKTNVGIGDAISVSGVISVYNGTNQIAQGSTVTITTPHTCETFNEATCTEPATCTVCGKENGEAKGHTAPNAEGNCDTCGINIAEEAATVTITKSVAELITKYGWTGSTTKQSFNLDDNVSVKIDGGSNTGKAYEGDHIRIYATDSPAGTITISVPEGYELESFMISTKTGGTYAFLYVDGTTTDISNNLTEVSGNSVLLKSVKNGTNGKQVQVTAFEVTYKTI